jgi:hypothetical protein
VGWVCSVAMPAFSSFYRACPPLQRADPFLENARGETAMDLAVVGGRRCRDNHSRAGLSCSGTACISHQSQDSLYP